MFEVSHYIGNFTSETTLEEKAVQVFSGLDISESSRKDYAARIGIFLEYVKEHKFSKDTFLEFKRYLTQRNDMSISTKSKYLTVGRVFLKELHRQGIIPVDITLNVKSFQQSTRHKRYGVNEDEVNHVKAQTVWIAGYPPICVRLKAIFALLIYQGLRQIEIRVPLNNKLRNAMCLLWGCCLNFFLNFAFNLKSAVFDNKATAVEC